MMELGKRSMARRSTFVLSVLAASSAVEEQRLREKYAPGGELQ